MSFLHLLLLLSYNHPVFTLATPFTKPNGDIDLGALTSHILQLEQKVSDLQNQNQAQEQKQSAVLSSVLSKLASTSDELLKVQTKLEILENEHNATVMKLNELETWRNNVSNELQSCRNDNFSIRKNITDVKDQLANNSEELKLANSTWADLIKFKKHLESDVPSLENLTTILEILTEDVQYVRRNLSNVYLMEGRLNTKVSYQVELTDIITGHKGEEILKFDRIRNNAGNGYNQTSGVFTVPVSGTYLFWCHVLNKSSNHGQYVYLYQDGSAVASGFSLDYMSTASITTVVSVSEGDRLWFSGNFGIINGNGFSHFGGALLHIN